MPSLLLWLMAPSSAAVLTVGPESSHPTIQSAIQAAVSGDVIEVEAGTYVGSVDIISKSVTVRWTPMLRRRT